MARKRRKDRYHLIYQLTAPNGERYVGAVSYTHLTLPTICSV